MISKLPGDWMRVKVNYKAVAITVDCYVRYVGHSDASWTQFSTIETDENIPYIERQLIDQIQLPWELEIGTYGLQFLFVPRVEGMSDVIMNMPNELKILQSGPM